jgi:hypothetical protein
MPRTVLRQEVYWVPENRRVTLSGSYKNMNLRVWTLYNETDEAKVPHLPRTPIHHQGAFLEDYLHDWNLREKDTVLVYGSRVLESGTWILVEHMEPWKRLR